MFFIFSFRKSSLFKHPKQAQIVGVSGSSRDDSEQGSLREGQGDVTLCTAGFYYQPENKIVKLRNDNLPAFDPNICSSIDTTQKRYSPPPQFVPLTVLYTAGEGGCGWSQLSTGIWEAPGSAWAPCPALEKISGCVQALQMSLGHL